MNTKIRYGLKELEKDFGVLTFATALESYRLTEELSQKKLAKKLKISSQSLCDLEKGRKIPTPERAARIAKIIKEPESFWIKLAVQDLLRSYNLSYEIDLKRVS